MYQLTGYQRDLLYIVSSYDDVKGEQIKEDIEDYYDLEFHYSKIHHNLEVLVDEKYVRKNLKNKRCSYYNITDKGKNAIKKRNDWVNKS